MLIVQDGHQTHTRASDAIGAGLAGGVVWSPGDQGPDKLLERIACAPFAGSLQAIDPQLYVARLIDANPKKIGEHGLFAVPMRPRDLAARQLPGLIDVILSAQAGCPAITHLIAPTVSVANMADRNAQTAVDLADGSIAWWDGKDDEDRPLLLSFALEQSLLADDDSVNGLLDEITGLDSHGFYLLFELPPNADPQRAAPLIHRALYVVNTLAENDFDVWVGYVGVGGYAMRAAGASTIATGWFQKQQWWSPDHWSPSRGRQPRPRAFLSTVVGSLVLETELDPLRRADARLYREIIEAPGEIASELREGRLPTDVFDRAECSMQLFATLAELDARIAGDVEDDLRQVDADLGNAIENLERIEAVIPLEVRSGTRSPSAWRDAVVALAADLGMSL